MPDHDTQPLKATVKYNPHLWGDDELRSIFVVRTRELDALLTRIRETKAGAVPQHLLIIGHRGMGKSTLLRRTALAVKDDAELSQRWIALSFPEEQYTVSTLAELWSNVLDALADRLQQEGASPAELHRMDSDIQRIGELPEIHQEEAALELLSQWITNNQRRVILLMDSTDLIFASLGGSAKAAAGRRGAGSNKAGTTPLWRLRKTLSHHPGILWLGASYQAMESESQYSDAFHDFFELFELKPLTVANMREAMLALARTFGNVRSQDGNAAAEEMARTLDSRPERLKILRAMTGGNPRTTVMLYDLFAAGWQEDIHTDIKVLLDIMTPLYKARMEGLADQPRKLLAHLMENWAPMSAQALGKASGIPTTTISGQLARLEADGLIEKAKLQGSKKTGYLVGERFFNIWYLMRYTSRRVRQRLTWLVEFMRLWYSAEELLSLARQRAGKHSTGRFCEEQQLEYSLALASALPGEDRERHRLEFSVFSAAQRLAEEKHQTLAEILSQFFDLDGEDRPIRSAAEYIERFRALDEKLAQYRYASPSQMANWISAIKGCPLLSLGNKEVVADLAPRMSETSFEMLISDVAEGTKTLKTGIGEQAYGAVHSAIVAGNFFPDCPEPEVTYRQALAEFGDDPDAMALGAALLSAWEQASWGERLLRKAIELHPRSISLWFGLGDLLESIPKRFDEAADALRQALSINPSHIAANAQLAKLLARMGADREASEYYRKYLELITADASEADNLDRRLQAHLWLRNSDLAKQALDALADAAADGKREPLRQLRTQALECLQIGLAQALADLLDESAHADFLRPIALALRAADGSPEALDGTPPELRAMAEEVLRYLTPPEEKP